VASVDARGRGHATLGTRARAQAGAPKSRFADVLIGIQSYSLRDRGLDEAIDAIEALGLTSCELWEAHVEPGELRRPEAREALRRWRTTTPIAHFRDIGARFQTAGIGLSAYNISFKDDFSDAEIARGFEIAEATPRCPLPWRMLSIGLPPTEWRSRSASRAT
jgi:sugar phosphate isomerase/epimerase